MKYLDLVVDYLFQKGMRIGKKILEFLELVGMFTLVSIVAVIAVPVCAFLVTLDWITGRYDY